MAISEQQSSVLDSSYQQADRNDNAGKSSRNRGTTGFAGSRFSKRDSAARTKTCAHPGQQLKVMFPAQDFVTHHGFQIAHCAACGFDITSPQPAMNEIAAYYPAGYYGNPGDRRFPPMVEALQKALYTQRVRMVESVAGARRGRVLDVGCGRGLLLEAFRRRGWDVQGTELTEKAARYAQQVAGVPVEIGQLEEIGFPESHFDAITMWHVLEHVHDPRVVLAEVSRILKPGGVLLVGVPNFSGFEARLFKDKWFHLDVPRHVTHLTKTTLKQALHGNGLQDRRWSGFAPEYDAFSFVQSALNRCGLRHNLLYNVLRGKQAKVIDGEHAPQWQVAVSLLLGAVLGVVSVPATFAAGLVGQAGTMTVLAMKR
jgi:2-polyprenyl-3-methyl-5-hydroxy-6-metoxy-1,4-benzoquinol methylase